MLTIILLSIFICSSCASKRAPSGGPLDKIAPYIISTSPALDSLNVPLHLKHIQIQFSERMDELSVMQNIFISPALKYQLEWDSDDEVWLNIEDSLLTEQTYVVSIGSGASDEHRNKMEKSSQFAFSTGSVIDRGSIQGKVYNLPGKSTLAVFAYLLSDTGDVNPAKQKPLYISQTSPAGDLELSYLKQGLYRVFVIEDVNKNQLFDLDFERIGIPFRDFLLDSTNLIDTRALFKLTKLDTIKPKVLGVRSKKNFYQQIRTSEPVIVPAPEQFVLSDSITGAQAVIKIVQQNSENENALDVFTSLLREKQRYRLSIPVLRDSASNKSSSVLNIVFAASDKVDTTRTELVQFSPEDSSEHVYINQKIKVSFSKPVELSTLENNFSLRSGGGRSVTGSWDYSTAADYLFSPRNNFDLDSTYTASLMLEQVIDINGRALYDTTISHSFSVISNRNLGELSGTITTEDSLSSSLFLTLKKIGSKAEVYKVDREGDGLFMFTYLPEGKYLLSAFSDLDGDSSYTYGNAFPFEYSEPFYHKKDTIKVRKRWDTSGISLTLPARSAHE